MSDTITKTTILEDFVSLLEDNVDPKKYFTKKKYEKYFEQYCDDHKLVFEHLKEYMDQTCTTSSENSQNALEESSSSDVTEKSSPVSSEAYEELFTSIAKELCAYATQELDKCKFLSRGNREAEFNIFLITSIFPCILRMEETYGESLCETIKNTWNKTFHSNIDYRTFEKLNESFRGMFSFLTGR